MSMLKLIQFTLLNGERIVINVNAIETITDLNSRARIQCIGSRPEDCYVVQESYDTIIRILYN